MPAENRIHILPPSVAERIAAGEVIERPSSVVKELVENSIDAGATEIQVVLEDGGKQLIEVTDNGHGMTSEDLRLSVQRHATSKLRTLDDLEKILTLGFRGEALPSVSAVSDLQILSRAKGDGHRLRAARRSSRNGALGRRTQESHFRPFSELAARNAYPGARPLLPGSGATQVPQISSLRSRPGARMDRARGAGPSSRWLQTGERRSHRSDPSARERFRPREGDPFRGRFVSVGSSRK